MHSRSNVSREVEDEVGVEMVMVGEHSDSVVEEAAKQMTKSNQCKVPTRKGQRLDHTTKLEASLPRQCRSHCH